jgi:hypothetical protein
LYQSLRLLIMRYGQWFLRLFSQQKPAFISEALAFVNHRRIFDPAEIEGREFVISHACEA